MGVLRLEAGSLADMKLTGRTNDAAHEQSLAFFAMYGDLFGMSTPERELQLLGVSADNYGARHVEYVQLYKGVPVFGALMQVHFNKTGDLTDVNGVFIPKIGLDAVPVLSADAAAGQTIAAVARQQDAEGNPAQRMKERSGAYVRYEDVTGGLAQDGLVTASFVPQSGDLTFYMRQSYAYGYGTIYTVRVSTNTQTTHDDFTTIQTYQEADFTAAYHQFNVDLDAYSGQAIYVAFVMEQDDGDNWYLDDIASTTTCVPVSGGMLVGNVTSADTGAGLNGATVASQEYVTVTAAANYVTDVQTPTIVADAVVVQDFALTTINYTLTMHLVGSGVISPEVGAHSYISGTVVDLSATPSADWQFDGWSGDLISADNPTVLAMDGHKEVTAAFTLTVSDTGGLMDSDTVAITVTEHQIFLPLVLRN